MSSFASGQHDFSNVFCQLPLIGYVFIAMIFCVASGCYSVLFQPAGLTWRQLQIVPSGLFTLPAIPFGQCSVENLFEPPDRYRSHGGVARGAKLAKP